MKDESEDWGRWRDVIFRAKKALNPVVEREWERDAKEKQQGTSGTQNGHERVKEMASFAAEQSQESESEDKIPDEVAVAEDGSLYCTECYLPLRPDPKPESLYIFLHAMR
jgi:tRNA pseudouridine synthase 9